MFSADRRIQEGTRDLALAFMLGRAEEALSRVSAGQTLEAKERSYFEQLLNLFADALEGYAWATGTAPEPPPSTDSLRAVGLVIPAVQDTPSREPPESVLQKLTDTARLLASARDVGRDERSMLAEMLRRLASFAAGQGRETLDSEAPPAVPALRTRLV
jgi:hypothetical protein